MAGILVMVLVHENVDGCTYCQIIEDALSDTREPRWFPRSLIYNFIQPGGEVGQTSGR
jgi:hypothetical protein